MDTSNDLEVVPAGADMLGPTGTEAESEPQLTGEVVKADPKDILGPIIAPPASPDGGRRGEAVPKGAHMVSGSPADWNVEAKIADPEWDLPQIQEYFNKHKDLLSSDDVDALATLYAARHNADRTLSDTLKKGFGAAWDGAKALVTTQLPATLKALAKAGWEARGSNITTKEGVSAVGEAAAATEAAAQQVGDVVKRGSEGFADFYQRYLAQYGDRLFHPERAAKQEAEQKRTGADSHAWTTEQARERLVSRAAFNDVMQETLSGEGPLTGKVFDALEEHGVKLQIDPEDVDALSMVFDVTNLIPFATGWAAVTKAGRVVATAAKRSALEAALGKVTNAVGQRLESFGRWAVARADNAGHGVLSRAVEQLGALGTGGAAISGNLGAAAAAAGATAATRIGGPPVLRLAGRGATKAGRILTGKAEMPLALQVAGDITKGAAKGAVAPLTSLDPEMLAYMGAGSGMLLGGEPEAAGEVAGNAVGFGALGGAAHGALHGAKRTATAAVLAAFKPDLKDVGDIPTAKFGEDAELDAATSDRIETIRAETPAAANRFNWWRAVMRTAGTDIYLAPTDVYADRVAAASGSPADVVAGSAGYYDKSTGRIYLNSDLVAAGHEMGHALQTLLNNADPEVSTKFQRSMLDAYGPQIEAYARGYDGMLGVAPGETGSVRNPDGSVNVPRTLDEMGAEFISTLISATDPRGLEPGPGRVALEWLGRISEQLGLYRPEAYEGAAGRSTLGVAPSAEVGAQVRNFLRDQFLSQENRRAARAGLTEVGAPPVAPIRPEVRTRLQELGFSTREILGMSPREIDDVFRRIGEPVPGTPTPSPAGTPTPPPAPGTPPSPAGTPPPAPGTPPPAPGTPPSPAGTPPSPAGTPTPLPAPGSPPAAPGAPSAAPSPAPGPVPPAPAPTPSRTGPSAGLPVGASPRPTTAGTFPGRPRPRVLAPGHAEAERVISTSDPNDPRRPAFDALADAMGEGQQATVPVSIEYAGVKPGQKPAAKGSPAQIRAAEQADAYVREALGAAPADVRALFEKVTVPYRWIVRGDNVNVQAMSPDKVAANAYRIAEVAGAKNRDLIPYQTNAKGEFTPEGWRAFASDVTAYTQNQANGYGGDGSPVTKPPGYEGLIGDPTPGFNPVPLAPERAQFVNLTMALPPPQTARAPAGYATAPVSKFPNVQAALLAKGNKRPVIQPARTTDVANNTYRRGTESAQVAETNPLRDAFAQRGIDLTGRALHQVTEELNLEGITRVTKVPTSGFRAPRTDLIRGGFMPKPGEIADARHSGQAFKKFFSDVTTGTEKYRPRAAWREILPLDAQAEFLAEYEKHRGNFDDHIATSIPAFRDVQVRTGNAIAEVAQPGERVLDIGASEGSWLKSTVAISGGKLTGVALDPNPDMARFFREHSEVPGAAYSEKAFLRGFVDDGKVVESFDSAEPFDYVHESMAFQFIAPERDAQIAEVKRLMTPDGVFLTEEKLLASDSKTWNDNEAKKDREWKNLFYSDDALKAKQAVVRFNQDPAETKAVGMVDNMVTADEFERVLRKHFKHVVQYWDSGNFRGYAASDSPTRVREMVSAIGDTNTGFNTTETPRAVDLDSALSEAPEGSGSFMPRPTEQLPGDGEVVQVQNPNGSSTGATSVIRRARTDTGRAAEKRGYRFAWTNPEGRRFADGMLTVLDANGKRAGFIEFTVDGPDEWGVSYSHTRHESRGTGLGEAMYRELATLAQEAGVTKLSGDVVGLGAMATRRKVFGNEPLSLNRAKRGHFVDATRRDSLGQQIRVNVDAQPQPKTLDEALAQMLEYPYEKTTSGRPSSSQLVMETTNFVDPDAKYMPAPRKGDEIGVRKDGDGERIGVWDTAGQKIARPEDPVNSVLRRVARTDAGRKAEKDGLRFAWEEPMQEGGTGNLLLIDEDGIKQGGILVTWDRRPHRAYVESSFVDPDLVGRGYGEALYRELATILQEHETTELGGDIVGLGAMATRRKVFGTDALRVRRNTEEARSPDQFDAFGRPVKVDLRDRPQPQNLDEALAQMLEFPAARGGSAPSGRPKYSQISMDTVSFVDPEARFMPRLRTADEWFSRPEPKTDAQKLRSIEEAILRKTKRTTPANTRDSLTGWVTPDGAWHPADTGTPNSGDWHGQWLRDHASMLAERFGLETEGGEKAREAAMDAGLVRLRYNPADGSLTVETSRKGWTKAAKAAVEQIVSDNIHKIDRFKLNEKQARGAWRFEDTGPVHTESPSERLRSIRGAFMPRPGSRVDTAYAKGAEGKTLPPHIYDVTSATALLENPSTREYAEKLVNSVQQIPGLRIDKSAPPDVRMAQVVNALADNIEFVYNTVAPEKAEVWRHWYKEAHAMADRWAKEFGLDPDAVSAINARLSTQKDWYENVTMTRRLLETMRDNPKWTEAHRDFTLAVLERRKDAESGNADAEKVKRIKIGTRLSKLNPDQAAWMIRAHNELFGDRSVIDHNLQPAKALGMDEPGAGLRWQGYNTIASAVRIYRSPLPATIYKEVGAAHKVRNFYNNHVDPTNPNDVTVDTHAVGVAILDAVSSAHPAVVESLGGPGNAESGYKGTYSIYADAYREAARRLGVLPREVQSVTWEGIRNHLAPVAKSVAGNSKNGDWLARSINNVHEAVDAGRLDPERGREVIWGFMEDANKTRGGFPGREAIPDSRKAFLAAPDNAQLQLNW